MGVSVVTPRLYEKVSVLRVCGAVATGEFSLEWAFWRARRCFMMQIRYNWDTAFKRSSPRLNGDSPTGSLDAGEISTFALTQQHGNRLLLVSRRVLACLWPPGVNSFGSNTATDLQPFTHELTSCSLPLIPGARMILSRHRETLPPLASLRTFLRQICTAQ